MKKIPLFTLLLWLLILIAYSFHIDWFLIEYVQYPLVTLLSILLPVSFWQKSKEQNKMYSAVFPIIFFINISFLLLLTSQHYNAQRSLENATRKGIIPEIAELLSETENSGKNLFAARHIYQNHGISMVYRVSEDSFALYLPSSADKAQYQKNAAHKTQLEVAGMTARSEMISTAFLLLLHGTIFMVLLPFLILYDQRIEE